MDGNDQELEMLWKTQYKLQDFLLPENFKSFEDLQTRLDKVLNVGSGNPLAAALTAEEDNITKQPASAVASVSEEYEEEKSDNDSMSYFSKLANEE